MHPALISATDLIGDVSGVANAVIVGANAVGSIFLVGPGAGGLPTASAVLGDLIEIARGTYSRMRIGQKREHAFRLCDGTRGITSTFLRRTAPGFLEKSGISSVRAGFRWKG
ncbi:MAG: hypothetical protein Ct9H300mP8_11270 [Gammaproteobacteria bacterium]|nr:MAG: hypothetical protein Ct9H300mP8_11270 [Gammaproteobacteria bacterium]